MIGKINTYTCQTCGGQIITEDIDEGVTPFMLSCRATANCKGVMQSAYYRVDQTLTPAWEWYRPRSLHKYNPAMKQHIQQGGLVLRGKDRKQ